MAIISAGVVMNVLFGLVMFIIAFNIGVHQTAPVVGVLEAGGPAWQEGVRPGDRFLEVDSVKHPNFEDLHSRRHALRSPDEQIPFEFEAPGRGPRTVYIEPRKTKGEKRPIIGLNPPMELKLPAQRDVEQASRPGAARQRRRRRPRPRPEAGRSARRRHRSAKDPDAMTDL